MSTNDNAHGPARVIALDLEGTLISNAFSCFPRPGLADFLDFCRAHFERVVMFTTVREARARAVLEVLVAEGTAPAWMRDVEFVQWPGKTKDLSFVSGADVADILLVDDQEVYVHTGQAAQWVPVECFDAPYADTDRELVRVADELRRRLGLAAARIEPSA